MPSLPKELRKTLEKAAKRARRVAEAGSHQALENLAVHHYEPWKHLDAAQQNLRNRLRAHGRQVGDVRDLQKKTQTIDHLAAECAYEQWHRMLFARFLAENELLIDPETKARVDLDLCRDLAEERGVDWVELASEFAVKMLPQIFRAGDPVLEVTLPPETRQELEEILESLPREIFLADDSLGWVYQFWQAERKKEINDSEVKIGADELSPVTQLFTEDYMVLFLLHNTLGAWWAGKVLVANPELANRATNEQQLREACGVGEIEWTYLRFIREDAGPWRPAAGTFDGWPKAARDITLLDPCMGSGHFLVFALPILAAMRAREESLSKKDAMLAVLRENLHGLELDPRCTQIAAFNLALATWSAIGYQPKMPRLRLACSGLSISATEKEWIDLAGADSPWAGTMAQMHALFKQAPTLGSLIDPKRVFGDLFESTFEKIRPALHDALAAEHATVDEDELAISAQGLLDAAELLLSRFTLVATNVPYLGRGKQSETLKEYCEKRHPQAKADLATCFVERCLSFCDSGGTTALVTPQNWLFLGTYRHLRKRLLQEIEWDAVARLGEHGFESSQAAGAFTALLALTARKPDAAHTFAGADASAEKTASAKEIAVRDHAIIIAEQSSQLGNPDSRIAFEEQRGTTLLSTKASSFLGLGTGDQSHYLRVFWEFGHREAGWEFHLGTVEDTRLWGGREAMIAWDVNSGRVRGMSQAEREQIHNQDQSGQQAWGKKGVAVGLMRQLRCTLYTGETFGKALAVIVPSSEELLAPLWAFCSDTAFHDLVRQLDHNIIVANGTLVKIEFDQDLWRTVAATKFPGGLPGPASDDPTQWLFAGHPANTRAALQVSVIRLLGYRWPRQTGSGFRDCPALGTDGLEKHADADEILCIPAVATESSASERLRGLLATAYESEWSPERLAKLLDDSGFGGRSLEEWLRDGFFEQHCELFHQTPFIWHIWDGLNNGFHVLVNYHKLAAPNGEGRRTLEKLIHTALGRDWIERQRHDEKNGVQGAQEKVVAAEHLRRELTKILEGETPYDLFIRWKPLHEQPIGWEPDINDGVRLNIRPFMAAKTFNGKSIFRVAPKSMKWGKDRGKEPARPKEDYPWFWSWDGSSEDFTGGNSFDGNRWNGLHYTRGFKEAARQRARGKAS